jgi:multidrug resistance efflux pump
MAAPTAGFCDDLCRQNDSIRVDRPADRFGYELWDYYMRSPWTRDARVQADIVTIAPDVSGFVDELRVKDNQLVRKGDVLFVLDRERYQRALATAEANVAARKADMDNARQGAGHCHQGYRA